jgi:hypothetical protein
VQIDAENNIYLCDKISETLIEIAPDGEEVFAVGAKGEGPEDHRDEGEPLFWPGCHIARSDCSSDPKVILYGEGGEFLRAISLEGYSQYNRLWYAGGQAVGVATKMDGTPMSGMTVDVFLVTLGPEGKLKNEIGISTKKLPAMDSGVELTETDWEIFPRLAIGDDGRIYVVRNLYAYALECYSPELELLWRLEQDVPAPRRTAAEIAERRVKIDGGFEPSQFKHVLRRIIPRADGEVWLERSDQGLSRPGQVVLDRISRDGRIVGHGSIEGLPRLPGDYVIRGDRLIWKTDDDVDAAGAMVPYLVVYRVGER